jgi:hypothetical protein
MNDGPLIEPGSNYKGASIPPHFDPHYRRWIADLESGYRDLQDGIGDIEAQLVNLSTTGRLDLASYEGAICQIASGAGPSNPAGRSLEGRSGPRTTFRPRRCGCITTAPPLRPTPAGLVQFQEGVRLGLHGAADFDLTP